MQNSKILHSVLVAFLLATSLSSCALVTGRETTTEYSDDVAITADVKTEIYREPSLKMFQISVETFKGTVQLSGFVDSIQQRQKAGEVARRVNGVKSVRNNLIVK
jgi:Predicted periplasmic or secreted lipoprotein